MDFKKFNANKNIGMIKDPRKRKGLLLNQVEEEWDFEITKYKFSLFCTTALQKRATKGGEVMGVIEEVWKNKVVLMGD